MGCPEVAFVGSRREPGGRAHHFGWPYLVCGIGDVAFAVGNPKAARAPATRQHGSKLATVVDLQWHWMANQQRAEYPNASAYAGSLGADRTSMGRYVSHPTGQLTVTGAKMLASALRTS